MASDTRVVQIPKESYDSLLSTIHDLHVENKKLKDRVSKLDRELTEYRPIQEREDAVRVLLGHTVYMTHIIVQDDHYFASIVLDGTEARLMLEGRNMSQCKQEAVRRLRPILRRE